MELLVQIISFGSAWWMRPGRDERDPQRYTLHAAYFNSTGVRHGRKVHTAGPVRGLIRFNVTRGLDVHRTHDSIGKIFRFRELEIYRETNRLLALGRVAGDTRPTHHLVCLDSTLHGCVLPPNHQENAEVRVISFSRYRGKHEVLLLVEAGARIHTTAGVWTITESRTELPRLHILDEPNMKPAGANVYAI
jgi:hypothetical protein